MLLISEKGSDNYPISFGYKIPTYNALGGRS